VAAAHRQRQHRLEVALQHLRADCGRVSSNCLDWTDCSRNLTPLLNGSWVTSAQVLSDEYMHCMPAASQTLQPSPLRLH